MPEPTPQGYMVTPEPGVAVPLKEPATPAHGLLTCKQCSEASNLSGMYGQYGYYVKCGSCNANTSMKQPCPACGWKGVRVSKDGSEYTGVCRKCEHQFLVYRKG